MALNEELKTAYMHNNLVLFIGSGLSKRFGLPDWKAITFAIIDEIQQKAGDSLSILKDNLNQGFMTPLEVLSILAKRNYKNYCYTIISELLKIQGNSDFSFHRKLFDLCPRIITTNYDHAFELALGDNINVINYDSNYKLATANKYDNFLIKIHGDLNTPDKCILFQEDYVKHYNSSDKSYLFELRKIISEKNILFIGFSNNDPFISEIFDSTIKLFEGFTPKHFLITNDRDFKHSYIETIQVENYDEALMQLIDKLYESKLKSHVSENTQVVNSNDNISENEVKVSLLFPIPLDRDFEFPVEHLQKVFHHHRISLNVDFLSINTIRNIDNGYIFIFTNTVKDNLIVEDEYLKSQQISLDELLENISNTVSGTFVFCNKKPIINKARIKNPVAYIIEDNKFRLSRVLSDLCHSIFKLKRIPVNFHTCNEEKFHFYKKLQSEFRLLSKHNSVAKFIDQKLLTKFYGRRTDIENLVRKFIDLQYKSEILTIKGSGGIGKTATVCKVAIELAQRKYFKDIYFIACHSISSYENFEYQISKCFNLDSSSELKYQIETKFTGKDVLLILDNFETLLNMPASDKVVDLVAFLCDYSLIVTTTRQLLSLEFEDVYELRSLTSEEGTELFRSFYKGRIKVEDELFLRREIISELLNNNPLAIKVIAQGMLYNGDLRQLHLELKRNIFNNEDIEKIFENPEDINIEKSKSLYHSIKYSYDKLNEKEKLAFELLSLFPDGVHFANFKLFVKKNIDSVNITEREINSLNDKSLLENINGLIRLQSIISRFSYFQFSKRDLAVRKIYYKECFSFNNYMLQVFGRNDKKFRTSIKVLLHDQNLNNYLKCFDFIEHVDTDDDILFDFVNEVTLVFKNINQSKRIIEVFKEKRKFFSGFNKGQMLLDSCILLLTYWTKDFDIVIKELNKILPREEVRKMLRHRDDKDYTQIDGIIYSHATTIYICEGYNHEFFTDWIKLNADYLSIDDNLYQLGFHSLAFSGSSKKKEKTFFDFEIELVQGKLNLETIDKYLDSLYKKETLEIVQSTYTKVKLLNGKTNINTKNFIITNPYTKGIIALINALQEFDSAKKIKHFENALESLLHIKFFYIEACYHFAVYLKQCDDDKYLQIVDECLTLAMESKFMYQVHLFNNLINDMSVTYDESAIYEHFDFSEKELNDFVEANIRERSPWHH